MDYHYDKSELDKTLIDVEKYFSTIVLDDDKSTVTSNFSSHKRNTMPAYIESLLSEEVVITDSSDVNEDKPTLDNSKLLIKLAAKYRMCYCMDHTLCYIEDRNIRVSEDSQKISVTFTHESIDIEQTDDVDAITEEDVTTMCTVHALHR